MLKSEDLIYKCGTVSILLLTAGFIGFTSKLLLKMDRNKPTKALNHFYDPDHGVNMTWICVLANDAYRFHYNDTVCHNRTLVHWHLPWVRIEVWKKFWKSAEEKRFQRLQRLKKLQEAEVVGKAAIATTPNETDIHPPGAPEISKAEKSQGDKLKQKPSEVLYTVLVGLVFLSAIGACWEVFKNKMKKDEGGGQGAGVRTQDRECSLAEFTMNRHLRRESQQHNHGNAHLTRQASFDIPAKVTQTLIHQSSLDRAFTKPICEEDFDQLRRNSMPSSAMSEKSCGRSSITLAGQTSLRTFHRQQSLDVTAEDTRKKPRHFIRRH